MTMIEVLKDYSGAEGRGADRFVARGSTHEVEEARAKELERNGLAKIVGAAAPTKGDDEQTTGKQAAEPTTKEAAKPLNKAKPAVPDKIAAKKG